MSPWPCRRAGAFLRVIDANFMQRIYDESCAYDLPTGVCVLCVFCFVFFRIKQEPYYRPLADEVVLYEAAYAARMPVMLKGPTGCGKSRFVEYMAWKLGRPHITVACNADMTASDLESRYLLDASGTRWQDGPLTMAARIGAICYLDEVVEARQDTTVVIHPLTDHRRQQPLA